MSKMKTAVVTALVTAAALLAAKGAQAQTKSDGPQRVNKEATVNQNKANAQELLNVMNTFLGNLPDIHHDNGEVLKQSEYELTDSGLWRTAMINVGSSYICFSDTRDVDYSNQEVSITIGNEGSKDYVAYSVTDNGINKVGSEVPLSNKSYNELASIMAGFFKRDGQDKTPEVKDFCSNHQSTLDLSPLLIAKASQRGK